MRRESHKPDEAEWRTRRVMRQYLAGESIPQIAHLVGWSEGRVRKVLREAGLIVTDEDQDGIRSGASSEEDRRRLLAAGWKSQLRGGLIVWHRLAGRGSWYTQDVALQILEAIEGGEGSDCDA
jgi:hypothetical protein